MSMIAAPTWLVAITTILIVGFFPSLARIDGPLPFRERVDRLAVLGFDPRAVWSAILTFFVAAWGAATFLAFFKGQFAIAAAVVLFAWAGVGWGLNMGIKQRESKLRNQLAEVAIVMSGAVRAGMAPAMALARSAAAAPVPLSPILHRIVQDYERGAPLRSAMKAAGDRLELDAFTLLITAVRVTLERGGRLDEALDQIADSICDQQRLEDKLEAATAGGRNALLLMAIFPFGFSAFSYQLDPGGYDVIFASFSGQLGVCGLLLLIYLALRWGKAILDRVGI